MTGERRRPRWVQVVLGVGACVVLVALVGLGTWQLQRLDWKLGLIAAVESRAFGPPVAPPTGPVTADAHAYLRVAVTGRFRHDLSARVKAITELGPGHWLMTPLETGRGAVWVNRGFVPSGSEPAAWTAPEGTQTVEGLLRITEPGGTLLERNDPAAGRWVSRDIAALSLAAGLGATAGYFIDADHAGAPTAWPRGGLTVVAFRNPHLTYAITWFAMAALFTGGMAYVVWDLRRPRPG